MSLYRTLITNGPLANIAFGVLLTLGLIAYLTLPREQDPEINFNWVNITTVLPGASAEDVEERVTAPLEDAIRGVQDVRFVSSTSRESVSNILVRFNDLSPRIFDKRISDLRRELQNKASNELPADAKDPDILEITTNNGFPSAVVALVGLADDEALRRSAYNVRLDLERLAGVDRVLAIGFDRPELVVSADPGALAARGLDAVDVADSVRAWYRDVFAGRTRVSSGEWLVRAQGQDPDPEALARLTVGGMGMTDRMPLDSLARIERARERPSQKVLFNGQPAVLMSITKQSGVNTLELLDRISAYIAERNPLLAEAGLSLALADDSTVPTREALSIMESNAMVGLALVFVVCWLFLGGKIALLVTSGILFSIAGTFLALEATGNTLNTAVLLGVVIVLGMLVDDAVVMVEDMYYRMERGADAVEAALGALHSVALPVLSSVATTMAAFLPLMLLPGILGKFMFVIPFVVTVGLAVSLLEAFWILPAHVVSMQSRPPGARARRAPGWLNDWRERIHQRGMRHQAIRRRLTHRLRLRYTQALTVALRHAWISGITAATLFVGAVGAAAGGLVRFEFFAFDAMRVFYINVDMPAGVALEETLARTEEVAEVARGFLEAGEARSVYAQAGIKFTDVEPLYGDPYGQVQISLNPRVDEMRSTSQVVEAMRAAIESLPGPSQNSFFIISGGPPRERPINVKVRSDDPAELRGAADAVKAIAKTIPGARDVVDDDVPGRAQLLLTLDREAIAAAGLDPARVQRLIRLHGEGEIVADLRVAGEKLEVRVRAPERRFEDITQLLADPIALPGGGSTTLGALVEHRTTSGRGLIRRHQLRRTITVLGDLDPGTTDTIRAAQLLREGWEQVRSQYPGADLDFSGELEDIQESLRAMPALFLMGLGLIYLILAAQFRSYWQPLMVMVTVPLAFTGVIIGLLLTGYPVSLYTLYGVIALTGITVNASIVLIDAANDRLARGMSPTHATLYAARRRVIPVLMTSSTTIAGLIGLALGIGGASLVWGPVASAIVFGLAISTVLTLFVVPLLYRLFMGRAAAPGSIPH